MEAYYCEALGLTPPELAAVDGERRAYLDAWAEGRMIGEWTHTDSRPRGQATAGFATGGEELPYGLTRHDPVGPDPS
jgi:hypothetical protein